MIDGLDGLSSTAGANALDSHIGQMLDGFSGANESPEPAGSETGAPPASDPSAVPENTTQPIGSDPAAPPDAAAPTGAPPVEAPPAAIEPPKTPDDDPFKDAKPATYKVDGQERSFEAIKLLGEHGGVIEAKDLPLVLQRLSERDHLYERAQASHQRITELEKLTEWRTKDDKGNEVILSGLKGVEAQRVQLGQSLAALQTLSQAFKESPMALLAQDAEGNIVWDTTAVRHLITQSALAEIRAEQAVRSHLATFSETVKQQATQQVEDAQLPQKLWAAVETEWVSQFPDLTPQDKQFLAAQLPRYTRDPQKGEEHLGRKVVDPSFATVIQDRAEMRKQHAESLKQTTIATSTADKENKAKLAASMVGKPTPKPTPAATPVKAPTPQESREQDSEAAWMAQEQSAARMIKARAG